MEQGRAEFGNIGNYYILETFFREIHRALPRCSIETTLQISERFCADESVKVVPMSLYYDLSNADNISNARHELQLAEQIANGTDVQKKTPFIEAVLRADLVVDFSGDIWGSNADLLAPDRFEVGLLKDKIVQVLGTKCCLMASSPGPFEEDFIMKAKEVLSGFDLVVNREHVSARLLERQGFDTSNVKSAACPAFLFDEGDKGNAPIIDKLANKDRPTVGFILCGFNFEDGPHNRWPRDNTEYRKFVEAAKFIVNDLGADVCCMSHSNGFELPPLPFKQIHGSDFKHAERTHQLLCEEGLWEHVILLDGIYDPWTTKKIISKFDMLVSGRIHGAVAGFVSHVPTVVLDYGHPPIAHKLRGFTDVVGARPFLCDPASEEDMQSKIASCWGSREVERVRLQSHLPLVQQSVHDAFDQMAKVASSVVD